MSHPDPYQPTPNGTHRHPRPTSPYLDLANRLLAAEGRLGPNAPGVAGPAERVCQKLSRRLSRLVSPTGSQAMLSRALHLTRGEFPFLGGVRAGATPEACLEGLDESMQDVDAATARQGLLAVVTTLLDMMVAFIGMELTLRLVAEVWMNLPLEQPIQPGTFDGQEADS